MWSFNNSGDFLSRIMFPEHQPFIAEYKCYPVSFIGRDSMEHGNKILLPQSALNDLAMRNITWPMLFRVENPKKGTKTHSGVLEFISDEGTCHIPYWMMQNLLLEIGDTIRVRNVSLPKATFVKLKPLSMDYWNISNPKAVLETSLRNYASLTMGDIIAIHYLNQVYEIKITDLKPAKACSIIETDMEVEFEDVPPPPQAKVPRLDHSTKSPTANTSSSGSSSASRGIRLDGKDPNTNKNSNIEKDEPWKRKIPHGVRTYSREYQQLVREGRIPSKRGGR